MFKIVNASDLDWCAKYAHIWISLTLTQKLYAHRILQKIAESTKNTKLNKDVARKQDVSYRLTLLYRESRDRDRTDKVKTFRQMCTNKGHGVRVIVITDMFQLAKVLYFHWIRMTSKRAYTWNEPFRFS